MSLEFDRGSRLGCFDPVEMAASDSPVMKLVLEQARTVAATRASVLLSGETGVGKGVVARLIHHWSNRREQPFVAVHCGAIPDTLIESELFGHERGSFTGAHRRKQGDFELAHGGTLFLDEIGTITPAAQIKLLDVLQEQRFHRVGGEKDIEVDVRIITASNHELKQLQEEGAFRPDLYFRLSVFPIEIPPLRERKEDLPRLVDALLERFDRRYRKRIKGLEPLVEAAFRKYRWLGNVRELENILERAVILETTNRITPESIPLDVLDQVDTHVIVPVTTGPAKTLAEVRAVAVARAERRYLETILAAHEGRIAATAEAAGITTRQLSKLLSRYEIEKADFKPPRPSGEPVSAAETAKQEPG